MADTDDLHDALALLADYHDHEDDDAQRCACCRVVAVVGTAVPTLQAQVAAGAERYTRAVAGADAVRGRLVGELAAVRAAFSGLVEAVRNLIARVDRAKAMGLVTVQILDDIDSHIAALRAALPKQPAPRHDAEPHTIALHGVTTDRDRLAAADNAATVLSAVRGAVGLQQGDHQSLIERVEAGVAARATLARVRAAVIACAYCNGVGAQVCLPGDVVEPCPACGGLRAALDPEGTAAQLAALGAK